MPSGELTVESHYTQGGLSSAIMTAIVEAGLDPDNLTEKDITAIGEFHVRGREATTEVAALVKLKKTDRVLDVGCGIGGPSRHLATEYGCHVTGLDLTEEYCQVAEILAGLTGLEDKLTYRHGNALDLPFEDASFDVVWTQHASMNISDRPKLYAEMHRVLKPGGKLAIYDVIGGNGEPLHFPVPWAAQPSISFLLNAADLRAVLEGTGFEVLTWRDASEATLEWIKKMAASPPARQSAHPHTRVADGI
ncbi:MAG: methyltransferase domain-containing protein [Rhodospirillales bacterium]|nr:methyltransferase domain-containing protein [Rhodospirillales bacterium]